MYRDIKSQISDNCERHEGKRNKNNATWCDGGKHKINQKREEGEEGIFGIEESATHIGWYKVIEGMYKTSPECNKGRINDQ